MLALMCCPLCVVLYIDLVCATVEDFGSKEEALKAVKTSVGSMQVS